MQVTITPQDITLEAGLLKVLSTRDNFDNYYHLLDHKRLQSTTSTLLKDYKKYYSMFANSEHIDFGLFFTKFAQEWHLNDMTAEYIEYYRDYAFPAIQQSNIDDVKSVLLGLYKQKALEDITAVANKGLNLEKLHDILNKVEEKINNIEGNKDEEVCRIDTIDFTELDKSKGIPFFLPALQNGLGSLVKGQFVVVSADYGTGKSAFVISQAAHTLKYLKEVGDERPILYFNSEGTSADIFGRACSNIYRDKLAGGFEEIVSKAEQVKKHFIDTFSADSLLVIQMTSASIDWIHAKIKKYNPALVIIDITDTLAPEEDVMHLKKVYDKLRLLSGKYCPIIGTSQSGDSSYLDKETNEIRTRKWLGDKALYGSKTGKGGAADTIITIGKDDVNKQLRYISTPKKKRGEPVNLTCELIDKFSLYKELAW